eukprot:scaffold33523_cov112-Isochrysis_galbana.AAC.5
MKCEKRANVAFTCEKKTADSSVKVYCEHTPSTAGSVLNAVPPIPAPISTTLSICLGASCALMAWSAATAHSA